MSDASETNRLSDVLGDVGSETCRELLDFLDASTATRGKPEDALRRIRATVALYTMDQRTPRH